MIPAAANPVQLGIVAFTVPSKIHLSTVAVLLLPMIPPTVFSAVSLPLKREFFTVDCIAAPTIPPTVLAAVMSVFFTAAASTTVLVRMSPMIPPTLPAFGALISPSLNETSEMFVSSAPSPTIPPIVAEASPAISASYT